jgi:hypothetical protein
MSIKIGVMSEDLDKQIMLLKVYPEIAEKHFRPAMEQATALAGVEVVSGIPVLTGYAISKFRTKVTGKALNITGYAGWPASRGQPYYINVVEYGAREHPLLGGSTVRTKKGQAHYRKAIAKGEEIPGVHVQTRGGWRTIGVHPGFAARGFLKRAFESAQPGINVIMAAANEAVVNELAVP